MSRLGDSVLGVMLLLLIIDTVIVGALVLHAAGWIR